MGSVLAGLSPSPTCARILGSNPALPSIFTAANLLLDNSIRLLLQWAFQINCRKSWELFSYFQLLRCHYLSRAQQMAHRMYQLLRTLNCTRLNCVDRGWIMVDVTMEKGNHDFKNRTETELNKKLWLWNRSGMQNLEWINLTKNLFTHWAHSIAISRWVSRKFGS